MVKYLLRIVFIDDNIDFIAGDIMTVKSTTKRRAGRPLKEESNAIKAEKAILDYKSGIIDLMEEARNTLKALLTGNSSDKVKEGVAKFIIEEGKTMYQEYLAEDEESGKDNVSETGKKADAPVSRPFTTDIIPFDKPKSG